MPIPAAGAEVLQSGGAEQVAQPAVRVVLPAALPHPGVVSGFHGMQLHAQQAGYINWRSP